MCECVRVCACVRVRESMYMRGKERVNISVCVRESVPCNVHGFLFFGTELSNTLTLCLRLKTFSVH